MILFKVINGNKRSKKKNPTVNFKIIKYLRRASTTSVKIITNFPKSIKLNSNVRMLTHTHHKTSFTSTKSLINTQPSHTHKKKN